MKKSLLWASIVCVLLGLLIFPVSAADSRDVQKGTPTVDGLLDEAYLSSATYTVPDKYVWSWGSFKEGDALRNTGIVYFLWDKDYLYVCAVIEDSTPTSAAGEKTNTSWENDALENWFVDNEGNDGPFEADFKIHHAADGTFFVGPDGSGAATFNFAKSLHAQTYTDTGYIVEAAFPMSALRPGRTFSYSGQINDIWDPAYPDGYAMGSQNGDVEYTLVGEADPADPTGAPTDLTPTTAPADPTGAPTDLTPTTAPAEEADGGSSLPLILGIAAAVCAAAAVVIVLILKKKKK
ncbi:MAG: hypothetical protein IKI50_07520 [Clostridia bacterium]|nr:hypothetical protein [Clostridia bacterium]